jgi:transglutaminase/protease-like cytokinesis protein 3
MRLLALIFCLIIGCDAYSQATVTLNFDYKRADSVALNFQRNKYYFYAETALELAEPFTTEKEKCRAIFRWIAANIKYDYAVLNDHKKDRFDPMVVYKTKKAVCGGYASLFQAMCEEAKLKCLYISGEIIPSRVSHAWNIVKLEGVWYVMDVTWASGYVSGVLSGSKFTKAFNEEWWMADFANASKTHFSEEWEWRQYIVGEKVKD